MLLTKIKFCFTILILFCITHANAQYTHIDSLKQQLAEAKADSVKIGLEVQISNAYSNTNLDSMVLYSRNTIQLLNHILETENADSVKMQILWYISDMYQYVSNDSMVFYSQQALLLCIKNRNSFPAGTEAQALSNLASALWWAGNYPDAKETYFKALKIAEPLADTMLIGSIYNGIAMVNRNAGNYREAIKYYTKAENLTRSIPDNQILNTLLVDKGKSYEQLGILDSAYTYVQEGLAMYSRIFQGKNVYGGGIHSALGVIYSKMGKEQLASEFFRKSFQLNSEVNNIRLLARGYCEFAEHFDRFNQRDSAIYYATKGLLIDQQFNLLVQQLQAATLLTKLYKQENKIDSAFKYQQLMIDTRDNIFSNEKINRLQTLEFNEQLRQQEKKEAIAKAQTEKEKEKQRIILYSVSVVLFLVVLLSIFIFRGYRQKQKANVIITLQKTEVEKQKHIIENKNKDIIDSINYAKRIQQSQLPTEKYINKNLKRLMKD